MESIYAGKILHINLTKQYTSTIDTESYTELFIGGRGIATALYWDYSSHQWGAFHENNPLIITMGPLSGIPGGLGGSRWGIFGKSPYPAATHNGRELFCYGNLGGTFGAELRFARYDGIVVTGKSPKPVIVSIEDETITFHDAALLWGKGTRETMNEIEKASPPRTRIMTIGPAGENLVPSATVFATGDASCSGGMGAVMGGKNLKAITVKGTHRKVPVARREELKEIEREMRSYNRGNAKVWGLDFMAQGDKTTKYPCFGCMAHCLRVKYRADNGDSGKFMCQSRFFYMHHAWGYYNEDNDVPFYANRICDDYGIDSWEVQSLIEWLLVCHNEGELDVDAIGLDVSKVGSLEFIESLVEMTALRQGFGEILALGAYGASRKLQGRAETLYTRTDPYDPRYCTVNTLLFPFETREPIQQLHEAGLVLSQWSSWAKGVEEAHISSDVIKGIGERFWGSEKAADMTTLEGKAGAAKKIQERQLAKEAIGVCDWMFPLIDIPNRDDHVGDPSFESRILSAATGRDISEGDLYRVGERIFNLQRAAHLRDGWRAREDDYLPEEWHMNPLETHVADPECIVPGKNGVVASQVGRVVDRKEFEDIRDEYYELRGWDVATGLAPEDLLEALQLSYIIPHLRKEDLTLSRAGRVSLHRKVYRYIKKRITNKLKPLVKDIDGLSGESLNREEVEEILQRDVEKFGHESIARNFTGWNKAMLYHFTDIDQYYLIIFEQGKAQKPVYLEGPMDKPDITYEMTTSVLKSLDDGSITGEQAYLKRMLRLKASFSDMMKLQSLNKL